MQSGDGMHSVSLFDVLHSQGYLTEKCTSIWVRGYRLMCMQQPMTQPIIVRLDSMLAFAFLGSVQYLPSEAAKIQVVRPNQWKVDMSGAQVQSTPHETHLLLAAPYRVCEERADEADMRARLAEAEGMLTVFCGQNAVYELEFEHTLDRNGAMSASGPVLINPLASAPPDLSTLRVSEVETASKAAAAMPPKDRARLRLSLRWFQAATRRSGVDAILSLWIAFETLWMLDSNILPLKEAMAAAYGLATAREAESEFLIGRMYGLRCRIVHGGALVPIDYRLLQYTEAVYTDLFRHKLGLPNTRAARTFLKSASLDLGQYLAGLLPA